MGLGGAGVSLGMESTGGHWQCLQAEAAGKPFTQTFRQMKEGQPPPEGSPGQGAHRVDANPCGISTHHLQTHFVWV